MEQIENIALNGNARRDSPVLQILKGIGSMLAITVSLLFGFTALAALAVIRSSLRVGSSRARLILAELAEIDLRTGATRRSATRPRPYLAPQRALAAA